MKRIVTEMTDLLTYQNYCLSRRFSPDITPDQWRKVYGDKVEQLEKRFQQEERHANVDPVFRTILEEVSSDT